MVASRDGYEAMWEREYAAALGCEFCDPALMAQQLAALRSRAEPMDEPDSEEPVADDAEAEQEDEEGIRRRPAQML